MTYSKPYRTATYERAVAALQALLQEEGPAQVYRACGDAIAYLQTPAPPPTAETGIKMPDGPLLLDMKAAAKLLGMSTTFLYQLVLREEIASLKIGRRRKIPYQALHVYIFQLAEQQGVTITNDAERGWEQQSTRSAQTPRRMW